MSDASDIYRQPRDDSGLYKPAVTMDNSERLVLSPVKDAHHQFRVVRNGEPVAWPKSIKAALEAADRAVVTPGALRVVIEHRVWLELLGQEPRQ